MTPEDREAPQQDAVLAYIKRKTRNGRPFPRPTDIAQHMGWANEASARNCLERLLHRGKLKRICTNPNPRSPSRRYTWELT